MYCIKNPLGLNKSKQMPFLSFIHLKYVLCIYYSNSYIAIQLFLLINEPFPPIGSVLYVFIIPKYVIIYSTTYKLCHIRYGSFHKSICTLNCNYFVPNKCKYSLICGILFVRVVYKLMFKSLLKWKSTAVVLTSA